MTQPDRNHVIPRDIIELAKYDPIINTMLEYWKRGYLTWEQMLMNCTYELSMKMQQHELESHKEMKNENR